MYLCRMSRKDQERILSKLNIEKLNPMQNEAYSAINNNPNTILLSPTGTGKTLAFLLPLLEELDSTINEIQTLILVPSRELAIQIEQVARNMGSGHKVNAIYGGRAGSKDKIDLKHRPAILVGTPGRVADHLRRETFPVDEIKVLILDEFDKSLEIGFEQDMSEIISALPNIEKRVLTSATQRISVPRFVGLDNPITIDYLTNEAPLLEMKTVVSPTSSKLKTLVDTLQHIGNEPGIIFCNFKDTIQEVSDYLSDNNIEHGCFYGGMEQMDRERALIKFRNGTHQLLVATDLAARGIDINELKFILHYELPQRREEFTHRNGRTARMNSEGTAYILKWKNESLPDFIERSEEITLAKASNPSPPNWKTLFISGGRKDKISKGDIAGLFFKQGKLEKDQLGIIEVKNDCSFVAVKASEVSQLIPIVNNSRLKKKKVRVSIL